MTGICIALPHLGMVQCIRNAQLQHMLATLQLHLLERPGQQGMLGASASSKLHSYQHVEAERGTFNTALAV